jgi:predicted nuclease of restriction endonuclease-like (RecB) superfamily
MGCACQKPSRHQKRITLGNEHDYIDLVFYHRIFRCQRS